MELDCGDTQARRAPNLRQWQAVRSDQDRGCKKGGSRGQGEGEGEGEGELRRSKNLSKSMCSNVCMKTEFLKMFVPNV